MSKRTERRIKWIVFGTFALVIAVVVVLYLLPAFRLTAAQQLGIVPGSDATKVAGPGEARLVVISYPEPVQLSQPIYRQVARLLLRSDNQVTDLATGKSFALPVAEVDSLEISSDRNRLLLQGGNQYAVIDLSSDAVTAAPSKPSGDWGDVFTRPVICSGVSPDNVYTLCIRAGGEHNTRYLWGNWEVSVRPYGQNGPWQRVYRGRGQVPIVGFAPDNKSVYMYNELGIWRAPIKK
ncbi:MAG TPA: hypothetical protein VFI42_15070 [Thermomicrobiaceae bacterium]|nr:hypothetical protein [Thermomicrobiaceae bacterium]